MQRPGDHFASVVLHERKYDLLHDADGGVGRAEEGVMVVVVRYRTCVVSKMMHNTLSNRNNLTNSVRMISREDLTRGKFLHVLIANAN